MKQVEEQLHGLEQRGRGESEEALEVQSALESLARNLHQLESQHKRVEQDRANESTLAMTLDTRVLKLKYADPMHLVSILERLVTKHGIIIPDPRTRSVVITDSPKNMERFHSLIEQLDVPADDSVTSKGPDEFSGYETFLVPGRESRGAPRSNRDVEILRDRVSDLSKQMQEIRALLEQLAKERPRDDDGLGLESPPSDTLQLQETLTY